MREILLPEAKPAFEWVNGRALQKVSPKSRHANAQAQFAVALRMWAVSRRAGMVGTEWHFQVKPRGEERRPLVPDLAFLSYETLPRTKQLVTEIPRVAPDVVVEVLSPGDREVDIAEKIRVYLKAGTKVVFVADPRTETVTRHDSEGRRLYRNNDVVSHRALPGFRLPVKTLFTIP